MKLKLKEEMRILEGDGYYTDSKGNKRSIFRDVYPNAGANGYHDWNNIYGKNRYSSDHYNSEASHLSVSGDKSGTFNPQEVNFTKITPEEATEIYNKGGKKLKTMRAIINDTDLITFNKDGKVLDKWLEHGWSANNFKKYLNSGEVEKAFELCNAIFLSDELEHPLSDDQLKNRKAEYNDIWRTDAPADAYDSWNRPTFYSKRTTYYDDGYGFRDEYEPATSPGFEGYAPINQLRTSGSHSISDMEKGIQGRIDHYNELKKEAQEKLDKCKSDLEIAKNKIVQLDNPSRSIIDNYKSLGYTKERLEKDINNYTGKISELNSELTALRQTAQNRRVYARYSDVRKELLKSKELLIRLRNQRYWAQSDVDRAKSSYDNLVNGKASSSWENNIYYKKQELEKALEELAKLQAKIEKLQAETTDSVRDTELVKAETDLNNKTNKLEEINKQISDLITYKKK